MIEPEFNKHLSEIEVELKDIKKRIGGGWKTFWNGILYGAGYVIGAVFVVIIIGWILNIIGVIPAFKEQVSEFRVILENIRNPR